MLEPIQFIGDSPWENLPAISTPLDALFVDYRKKHEDIERIAAYVAGETAVMHYFMDGAEVEHRAHSISAANLFQADHAIRSLDASFWSKAMSLTDVLEYMPAAKRNEWHEQIRSHKTPPFETESVKATLRDLLAQRASFFAERIDGIFRSLSHEHVTNRPNAFGERFIISWMLDSWGYLNHGRANLVHDLRCVTAIFAGRDAPFARITHDDLDRIIKEKAFGQWHDFDGGAFRLRLYKKGTVHLHVHPDLAWRLNATLASLYPAAIPPEFRRKPVKAKQEKSYVLDQNLVSFGTLKALTNGRLTGSGKRLTFYGDIPPAAEQVLSYLGGVKVGRGDWEFDYPIGPALAELQRVGSIPEQKSHQFYATQPRLAEIAVGLAEIGEDDDCLEPSAGTGGLAGFMPIERTTCVEVSRLHCSVLEAKGFNAVCEDFLKWEPRRQWSRIVMNPPFSDGRAVAHVTKAASLLASDGRLVAILPAGCKGKEIVPGFRHEWGSLHQGEFLNTSVAVVTLVLTHA